MVVVWGSVGVEAKADCSSGLKLISPGERACDIGDHYWFSERKDARYRYCKNCRRRESNLTNTQWVLVEDNHGTR